MLGQVVSKLGQIFPPGDYPQLLVGLDQPDDAAIYQLDAERALISTTDFFPPVVDDAYDFGAIAAANAMSDVYAMGGEVLFGINLAAWPDDLDPDLLVAVLRGGAEKMREGGAVIAGGHTVSDKEPKYGIAVTGLVHPQRILTKGGAHPGDVLILTKPLGSGVITTALKRQQADPASVTAAVQWMKTLNRSAMQAAQAVHPHVHAATDITGFGLTGHAHEMAHLAGLTFEFDYSALPWMDGALRCGEQFIFAGGVERNINYFGQWITWPADFPDWRQWLLCDPQTSGGLLLAVAPTQVDALLAELTARNTPGWIIGRALSGPAGQIVVR